MPENDTDLSATETTGLPDVPDFDIDAWIDGKVIPRDTLRVTNDVTLAEKSAELARRIDEAKTRAEEAQREGRSGGRRAGAKDHPDVAAAKDELKALLAAHDQTWLTVHLRALDAHEAADVSDKGPRTVDKLAAGLALCATLTKDDGPHQTLTEEKWHAFLNTIGAVQSIQLNRKMNALADMVVTPDFSERASSILETSGSSSS